MGLAKWAFNMHSQPPNGKLEGETRTSTETETDTPLEKLSWTITKNASIVSQHLHAHALPQPSFDRDGPSIVVPADSPHSVRKAQQRLISAAIEILQLAIGPSEFLPNLATGVPSTSPSPRREKHTHDAKFQYISCLSWLCEYRIFHLVPLDAAAISYADLAAATGAPEQRLKSILRMAMTSALFREQPCGTRVAHSAASALLARDSGVYAYAAYMCARSAPTAMQMAAAHRRWGAASTRPNETAYNAAFGTELPFFDHVARDERRVAEFAAYMRNVRSSEGVDLKHLVAGFAWEDIPDGGVVVDVSVPSSLTYSRTTPLFPG